MMNMMNNVMVDNMGSNRNEAIEIVKYKTDLRLLAYRDVIEAFKKLDSRTMDTINYINLIKKLMVDDIKVLTQYQTEFIEESNMSDYFKCESIKASLIYIMTALDEVL